MIQRWWDGYYTRAYSLAEAREALNMPMPDPVKEMRRLERGAIALQKLPRVGELEVFPDAHTLATCRTEQRSISMPTFTPEEQIIRDLAIAYHAEQGHTLNISFIAGHTLPGNDQNCVYTVTGRVLGEACSTCGEPHPVPTCMLFLRTENGFVLLSNGESKPTQSEEQSNVEPTRMKKTRDKEQTNGRDQETQADLL